MTVVGGRGSEGRAAVLLLLTFGVLVAGALWVARGDGAEAASEATRPHVDRVVEPPFAADDGVRGTDAGPAPAQRPDQAAALAARAEVGLPGRAIAGQLVARDGSPVGPAEVIALEQLAGIPGESEMLRVRADVDGRFEMRAPRGPSSFRVLLPEAGQGRDATRFTRPAAVVHEWAGGDPAANDVRLVLATD